MYFTEKFDFKDAPRVNDYEIIKEPFSEFNLHLHENNCSLNTDVTSSYLEKSEMNLNNNRIPLSPTNKCANPISTIPGAINFGISSVFMKPVTASPQSNNLLFDTQINLKDTSQFNIETTTLRQSEYSNVLEKNDTITQQQTIDQMQNIVSSNNQIPFQVDFPIDFKFENYDGNETNDSNNQNYSPKMKTNTKQSASPTHSTSSKISCNASQSTVATLHYTEKLNETMFSNAVEEEFVDDDYKKQPDYSFLKDQLYSDHEDNQEYIGLLKKATDPKLATCLEGWHVGDNLHSFLNKEKLNGFERIHHQATQLCQIFKEFGKMTQNQQNDFELLDDSIICIKSSAGSTVGELQKANKKKLRARKRRLICLVLTLCLFFVFVTMFVMPSSLKKKN